MSRARRFVPALLAAALAGCQPTTTRPPFQPVPEAARVEIRLRPREAIAQLVERLRADSIPAATVRLRDGYLESGWFDAASGAATRRRPIGPGVVRVRGWVDPGRPGHSVLTVETTYRPLVDPSLPERELEREVPRDHPTALRVQATLKAMADRYGTPPPESQARPSGGLRPSQGEPSDEAAPEEPPLDESESGDQ